MKRPWKTTTTKRLVWLLVCWGMACASMSYVLAFFDHDPVASLSEVIVGGTVVTVLGYLLKALFEKRDDFGGVGKRDDEECDGKP